MEPSGIMDNKSLHDLDKTGFTVCDLADEEVHFSRSTSEYYYYHHQNPSSTMNYHSLPATVLLDANFTDINLLNSHQQATNYLAGHASSDQVTSSKLLNSIGSRLRRSSNYLIAPKLVGQYLLGITIQGWSEFLDTSRMMKPPSNRHQLARRLLANLNYFRGNYLCVSLILIVYCILTSPLLLLAIAGYLLSLYLVTARSALGKQMRIVGCKLNLQQQYSFITMISLPLLWVAGAPSAVFWVIGASFFVVGLHASVYAIERLSTDPVAVDGQHGHLTNHTNPAGSRSLAQYYNHYPGIHSPQAYSALSQPSSLTDMPPTINGQTSSAGGYVSNTLSQWITFGKSAPTITSQKPNQEASSSRRDNNGHQKVPDVKIISQDYAGLGRVYEV